MRISVVFTTLFAALSVLALPLAQRDSEPSLSLRSDNVTVLSGEAAGNFYIRALTEAQKAAKAARGVAHKAAASSKTHDQVKNDRKTKKNNRAAKVVKAKAKLETNKAIAKADPHKAKGLKTMTHEEKIKKKAKVEFSAGASRRLSDMGLHGKARKAAKKFQKNIMVKEMKKKGATKGIVVATLHTGGTVKEEKNHITAQFHDAGGEYIKSSWTDKTGETREGEKHQHHVYPDKAKIPSVWTNAVDASNTRKLAAEESKKIEKSAVAKSVGELKKKSRSGTAEAEAKRLLRAEKKATTSS